MIELPERKKRQNKKSVRRWVVTINQMKKHLQHKKMEIKKMQVEIMQHQ